MYAVFVVHVGGMDDSGNKGGIIDKLSTGRRRFKENFAQKTGREGVDNSEFEERFHRVTELRDKVLTHLANGISLPMIIHTFSYPSNTKLSLPR